MRKKLLLKTLFLKMYSYQNKMLLLRNFMNVLSSSFTSMQYFLNKLLVRKKLTTEEYCFYYQRTTQKTFQRRFKVAFRLI